MDEKQIQYAKGGYIEGPLTTIRLTKPLMSLASYRALTPEMRAKLPDVELVYTSADVREFGAASLERIMQEIQGAD